MNIKHIINAAVDFIDQEFNELPKSDQASGYIKVQTKVMKREVIKLESLNTLAVEEYIGRLIAVDTAEQIDEQMQETIRNAKDKKGER